MKTTPSLPSEPDSRQLSAADAAHQLRRWLTSANAQTHLAGIVRQRLETLIDLFAEAAQRTPGTQVVSLQEAIIALFGADALEAADPTVGWRKFVQQLRAAFEEMQCPLDIEFHKARGALSDRSVWFRITLSQSQVIAEEAEQSNRNLPDANFNYDPEKYVEPNLAVPAAGRVYPERIASFLETHGHATALKEAAWSEALISRLRGLGAALRPLLDFPGNAAPRLAGFWLEPTDRGGTWPQAILPTGPDAPADAPRWFAAAWLCAALEAVHELMALARTKSATGLRFAIHFPAGWQPEYADISSLLHLHAELKPYLIPIFDEVEVDLLCDIHKGFCDHPALAATEKTVEAWRRRAGSEVVASAYEYANKERAAELYDTRDDRLIELGAKPVAPLLLCPSAADPERAVRRAWVKNKLVPAWRYECLLVGDAQDANWPELLSLGQQGRGAFLALPAKGPESEIAEVLEMVERRGWTWTPIEHPSRALFDINGSAGSFRLFINLDDRFRNTSPIDASSHKNVIVLGRQIPNEILLRTALPLGASVFAALANRPEFLNINKESLPLPSTNAIDAATIKRWMESPKIRRFAARLTGVKRHPDGGLVPAVDFPGLMASEAWPSMTGLPAGAAESLRALLEALGSRWIWNRSHVQCFPDLPAFDRWLEALCQAELRGSPYAQESGVQRMRLYEPSIYEDLRLEGAGPGIDHLLAWARGQGPRQAVILGEYGAGKTFLTRLFAERLQEARRSDPQAGPVPVYIDLREVPLEKGRVGEATAQAVLRHMLQRLRTSDQSDAACLALRDAIGAGLILLVLDGFDEIATLLPQGRERTRLLNEFLSLGGERGRILLTSRTHFFDSQREEDRHFGGRDASDNRDGRGEILRLYVQPFEPEQIESALRKRLGSEEATRALGYIEQIHNLPELAQRPVLLDMIARSIDRLQNLAEGGSVLGAADLYDLLIQEWLERDKDKSTLTAAEKRLQMAHLAVSLWRSGRDSLFADRLPAWLQAQMNLRLEDRDLAGCEMRTASFLTRDAEGNFRFAHTSFGEYFLAVGLREELDQESIAALNGPRLAPEVVAFLASLINSMPHSARQHVERHLRHCLTGPLSAAVNGLLLLAEWQRRFLDVAPRDVRGANLSKANLADADLRHLRISDSDFSESNLSRCLLDHAAVTNSRFVGARLFRTSLRCASLAGCALDRSDWEQTDATDTNLSRTKAEAIRICGGRLVRCGWQGSEWHDTEVRSPFVAPLAEHGTDFLGNSGHLRTCCSGVSPPLLVSRESWLSAGAVYDRGRLVMALYRDGSLQIWDADSGGLLRVLRGVAGGAPCLAFSEAAGVLLLVDANSSLQLLDLAGGFYLSSRLGDVGTVSQLACSQNGRVAAAGLFDGSVVLWDLTSATCIRKLEGRDSGLSALALLHGGEVLASGFQDGMIMLWRVDTGERLSAFLGHNGGVECLTSSFDGRCLISGGCDGAVKVWDGQTGDCLQHMHGESSAIYNIAASPNSPVVAAFDNERRTTLWDIENGRSLRTFPAERDHVPFLTFTPNGKYLLSGIEEAGELHQRDTKTGDLIQSFQGANSYVAGLAYSSQGNRIAVGCSNGRLLLSQLSDNSLVDMLTRHVGSLSYLAFSPDGNRFACGSWAGALQIRDTVTAQRIAVLTGHEYATIRSVVFSWDSQRLVSGSDDGTLRLWDAASGKCLSVLKGHDSSVLTAGFSSNSLYVVSGSWDQTVRLWDAVTGECLRILNGHEGPVRSLDVSSDSRRVASGSDDGTVRLWDAASGECLQVIAEHTGAILFVCFSKDSKLLITVSSDGLVCLRDAASGRCLEVLKGHENTTIQSAAFSWVSQHLVTGSDDGAVRLWNINSGQCIRVITSNGAVFGPDGWPVEEESIPEALDGIWFPSSDGHSYSAREILEARAMGLPVTVTPLSEWGKDTP